MLKAKGYKKLAEAEVKSSANIQDLIDFGISTMLDHLEEDKEVKDGTTFELYEDYSVYSLTQGETTYYKLQTEVTNHRENIKATLLITQNTRTSQEFLEDYRYEIFACPRR